VWKRRSWTLFIHLSRTYNGASSPRLTCNEFPVNDLVLIGVISADLPGLRTVLRTRQPPADVAAEAPESGLS